jgi:hypothetical protein
MEIRDLHGRIDELEMLLNLTRAKLVRRHGAVPLAEVVDELLAVLRRVRPETDSPEDRVLLGDLTAAIETRHEYWPD